MTAAGASLESLSVGDTFLSKYEVRGLIGRGGQATVYRSYDTFIDREVAIKIMADSFDAKREHRRRAQMEARVLCKLHHPNIVHVYDAGSTDSGAIYIIMELLQGRTLRDVLRRLQRVSIYEALSIGAQIADGVELAHRQQVIHRDLKPENVFIVEGNAVKVLDFGIAKFLTLTGITTQRDTLQGTMWYISPEHVQGHGVTARSDIYALGSILYEAISGTPPCLVGLQEVSTQSVAWSQITRVPPQVNQLDPSVPGHVARLIQRMLVKDPSERPATMAEVAADLRSACKRLLEESVGPATVMRNLWKEELPSQPRFDQSTADLSASAAARREVALHQRTLEIHPNSELREDEIDGGALPKGVARGQSGIMVQARSGSSEERGRPSALATVALDLPTRTGALQSGQPQATRRSGIAAIALRRHRWLIAALALGALLGVGLGFSETFSARLAGKHFEKNSQLQQVSAEASPPVSDAPAASVDIARNQDAGLPGTTSRAVTNVPSALPVDTPQNLRIVPSPTAAPRSTKKASGREPKPRYSAEDLE